MIHLLNLFIFQNSCWSLAEKGSVDFMVHRISYSQPPLTVDSGTPKSPWWPPMPLKVDTPMRLQCHEGTTLWSMPQVVYPNGAPCFDWNFGLGFGGLTFKNRGHLGFR